MAVIDVSKYAEMDAKYADTMYRLWGPTLLGFPADTDSSRALMATSQQKQFLTLLEPDVAYVLTGTENIFGRESKSFKEMRGTWECLAKIDKFGDGSLYTLVLYNKEKKIYDMIQRPVATAKAEKFGFLWNADRMDQMKVGDTITDEVLFRSTSYDEHMNYRLGKNALVMYSTSNPTIEDAIYCRKGWADSVRFSELDNIFIPFNDNDIFTNRMGTDEQYIAFPMVGERVQGGIIASTRRIVKDHILYDFQSKNLRESYPTDTDFFTSKDALVYDIDVYYNGDEEMPDNLFYRQIKYVYQCCCDYADAITAWGRKIKELCKEHRGRRYTQRVPFLISRYKDVSDRTKKWKYKDREFSNALIHFKTHATVSLGPGFKLVGRYGDKGVISKLATDDIAEDTGEVEHIEGIIQSFADALSSGTELTPEEMAKAAKNFVVVPDSEMPYMEDGRKVDVLLNSSGAIRRLNNGQLVEVDLAFCMECIWKRIKELDDMEEKFNLLFQFLEIVNEDEYKFFYAKYASWSKRVTVDGHTILMLDRASRDAFMRDVEEHGIYLVKPPHKCIRYDTVKKIYHTFPWIQPVQLYIDKFGIARKKIMRKCIVGYKYLYALKQTSNKNFSARSMGRVNKKGLPEKSTDKRDNRSEISHNPLKLGEVHNLMSSISGRTMAEHNIFTRSSPVGRRSMIRILKAAGNPMEIHKLKVRETYRNVNADIFNAYLKCWGIGVDFLTDSDMKEDIYIDIPQLYTVHGYQVFDLPSKRGTYEKLLDRFEEIFKSMIVISENVNEAIWKMIFAEDDFKDIPKDMQEVCRNATLHYYDEKRHFQVPDEEDEG